MELEVLLVEFTHVLALGHLLEVLFQLHQLAILSRIIGQNGNAVFELEDIRVGRVIHQHHATQIPIYYAQVLSIDVLVDFYAVLPV